MDIELAVLLLPCNLDSVLLYVYGWQQMIILLGGYWWCVTQFLTVNELTSKSKRQLGMNMSARLSVHVGFPLKHFQLLISWMTKIVLFPLLLLLVTVTEVMSAVEENYLPSLLFPITCQNQRNVNPKTRGVFKLWPAVIYSYLRSRKWYFLLKYKPD